MGSVKEQSLTGFKWNLLGQFSTYAIQFVLGVVIARLLTPDDYGVVGMTTIFLAISQSLADSGFGNALIRKIDRTERLTVERDSASTARDSLAVADKKIGLSALGFEISARGIE